MNAQAFEYVDTEAAVAALTRQSEGVRRIAIDTEANSLHNYLERVCLIQISLDDAHFVVDPLAAVDLGPLFSILKEKELILHGADYDLRLLRSTFDFVPGGEVFDTMLAAQLLGVERVGYAALVEHFFDVTLSKRGQKSNWARRPLTESQLRYAMDDTRYLGPLTDLLREELAACGRDGWHREWCRRVAEATRQVSARNRDEAWRIRGLGSLDRKQLAYVRELWRWREREAREADRPPFKVLGNQQLIELAVWASEKGGPAGLDGRKLPRHCEGRRLRNLQGALREAGRAPKSKWPPLRRRRREAGPVGPERRPQIEALRKECARLAEELGVAPSVLAPKATLVAIARNNAVTAETMKACSGMMDWQAELLEEPVRSVLAKFA